ncbi:MAG: DUF4956 domain-containing protein [Oscillospiraceae bacterium]
MNKQEIFSYLTNNISGYTVGEMLFNIAVIFVITLFIYGIYVATTKRVNLYSNFGVVIVLTSVVTGVIMMVIQSNLALSLGMVGALSIIRFRSAIKDPIDTTYIFWAVAVGLAAGTGNHLLAVISSIVIGAFVLIFNFATKSRTRELMIVRGGKLDIATVSAALDSAKIAYNVKSKSCSSDFCEYIYELNAHSTDELLSTITSLDNVDSVNIVNGVNA